jgi:signal transduction histidine kinase/DNA-binding NarL/FixJ family response regulator
MLEIGKIYDAIITELVCNGLLVFIPQFQITEVIRTREISFTDRFKGKHHSYAVGDKVRVKVLQKIGTLHEISSDAKQRYQLSIRLAEYDPWDDIVNALHWHPGDTTKWTMQILFSTTETATGEIIPGVTGMIKVKKFADFLSELNPQNKMDFHIHIGDLVAGYIDSICLESRTVYLNMESYLKELHQKVENTAVSDNTRDFDLPAATFKHSTKIKNILLVDDIPLVCNTLKESIEKEGYSVFVATGAHPAGCAIELLDIEPVDLLLLDIHLPAFNDSVDVLNEVSLNYPHTKIILSTGNDNFPSKEQLRILENVNISDFLRKPFSIDELFDSIAIAEKGYAVPFKEFFNLEKPSQSVIIPDNKSINNETPVLLLIETLRSDIRANAVAVFELNSDFTEVTVLFNSGIDTGRLQSGMPFLHLSPVKECAVLGQQIQTNTAYYPRETGRHKNLMRVVDYTACVGQPMKGPDGAPQCIFAFKLQGEFSPLDIAKVETASARISLIIHNAWYMNAIKQQTYEVSAGISYGMLGHELKTKLVAASAIVKNMKDAFSNRCQNSPDGINANIDKLHGVVDRMLKISSLFRRIAEQSSESRCNILSVIESARKEILDYTRQENMAAVISISKPENPLIVLGADNSFIQILFNVFLNAIQQSLLFWREAPAVIAIKVATETQNKEHYVVIDIRDHGPGIHHKDFENIFKPMVTTRPDGAGLGLHFCRTELRRLNGDIYVKSSVLFAGTVFRIRLPVLSKNTALII